MLVVLDHRQIPVSQDKFLVQTGTCLRERRNRVMPVWRMQANWHVFYFQVGWVDLGWMPGAH